MGFDAAPRLLGTDDRREILTFVDGDVPVDPQWTPGRGNRVPSYTRSDTSLVAAARLLPRLHQAARRFQPVDTGYRFHPHPPRAGEIVSHGDLGPWNTVYRDGVPVAFIDWDCAGPVEPVVDFAAAAWEFVPLAPPALLRESGFDPVPNTAVRLRKFADAYSIDDRRTIVPALQRSRLLTADRIKYAPLTPAQAAENLEFRAQELRWLHAMIPHLDSERAS